MQLTNRKNYRDGMRDGIPIAMGYFAVSFTLGIAAKKAGLTALQATVMSFTNNTSAGEFAALATICANAPYLEMALMQFIINLRYMLMSCALSQRIDGAFPFFHRLIMGFGVTDEIFAISVAQPGKLNPFYTYGAMSLAIPAWSMGTLLGVLFGSILPGSAVSAFSVALYGMFLAIIIPPAKENRLLAGLIALSMALSFMFTRLPVLKDISSGMRVIILTVLIAGGAAILFPVEDDNQDKRASECLRCTDAEEDKANAE